MRNQGGHVSGLSVAQVIQQGAGATGKVTKYRAFESVNADPTSAPGLDRAVGSIVVFRDGSLSWIKYSVAATAWRSVSIQGTNSQNEALFYGEKAVYTYLFPAKAAISAGQYVSVGGQLLYATSGGSINVNLASATTEQEVAVAFSATINAQTANWFRAGIPVDGLLTLTAKNKGQQYSVTPKGTIAGTGALVTLGTNAGASATVGPEVICDYTTSALGEVYVNIPNIDNSWIHDIGIVVPDQTIALNWDCHLLPTLSGTGYTWAQYQLLSGAIGQVNLLPLIKYVEQNRGATIRAHLYNRILGTSFFEAKTAPSNVATRSTLTQCWSAGNTVVDFTNIYLLFSHAVAGARIVVTRRPV